MIAVRRLHLSIYALYLLAYSFNLELVGIKPVDNTYFQQSVGFAKRSPQCQTEDVETLTAQLLPALPSYANRISQRTRRRDASVDIYTYVIIAGRPEFAPLTLGPGEYTPDVESTNAQQPQQVFITTLERQYIDSRPVELQQFHWLFFTRAEGRWRLAIMFSRTGLYPSRQPLTPPRDSSNGTIAQAIRTWLRDCQT
ncbi:hypothetical protein [Chroogloeocystis siderophila]|jgi:hypothetical protein|uniref:Uncharacterized protein n=1 Tax=Chroogloeocystis siderophila 5.2 s.c.1 TaxID=247279 RepID=A0A1U7HTS7_9CHRO|nr:hypothetical protein NIES1031_09555 [Chroogloeocystis siderophila 5.2 s.c.1]